MESYVMENGRNEWMGYDKTPEVGFDDLPSGCRLYLEEDDGEGEGQHQNLKNNNAGFREAAEKLREGLRTYERLQKTWTWDGGNEVEKEQEDGGGDDGAATTSTSTGHTTMNEKRDLRDLFDANGTNQDDVCDLLELHPDGMAGIFPDLSRLSRSSSSSSSSSTMKDDSKNGGIFLEPLLPPLRHPEFCFEYDRKEREGYPDGGDLPDPPFLYEPWWNDRLMDLGFLVHDFAAMCRHKLRKNSRTVFLDMGASLTFHGKEGEEEKSAPALRLLRLYEKFGFVFDHIYGYELNHHDADGVYRAIPDDLKASYHWYNVGVDASRDGTYRNPFAMIADSFRPDDFVVVKLDIDSTVIENPLAEQLSTDPVLRSIVDVFYYEHHVALKELAIPWGHDVAGSMQQSMELFRDLRKHGIAAHYWI